jgi:hypothetical protein
MGGALADPIRKIVVRVHVGGDRMAGTDDPVFLGLRGASGREFRLGLAKGKALRRKGEEEYVFGPAGDAETNVAHAELNDPTRPPLDVDTVTGVYLRKRQEPIPNVRGIGELDDRVQLESVEVELVGEARTHRWRRDGPFWLGLACGLSFDLAPADEG